MADQITNYQCPACTGPLHFVGASGRLECDYCGSSYSVDEIEALYQRKDAQAAAETAAADEAAAAPDGDEGAWTAPEGGDWAEDGMQSYTCPSCGAELVCDASTAATSCPYCGNPSIVPGRLSGAETGLYHPLPPQQGRRRRRPQKALPEKAPSAQGLFRAEPY